MVSFHKVVNLQFEPWKKSNELTAIRSSRFDVWMRAHWHCALNTQSKLFFSTSQSYNHKMQSNATMREEGST